MNICYQRRDVLISKKSQRSLRRLSILIDWFSTGIKYKNQIWATCTRDSAPKWIAKTHVSHWVHVYSPCNKFQTLRILIFNSSNPKLIGSSWNLSCCHMDTNTKWHCTFLSNLRPVLMYSLSNYRREIINNWEPISQMDYLFEPSALDQQWIRAMLRLSNKAAALIIQIEKQYTCRRATRVACEQAWVYGTHASSPPRRQTGRRACRCVNWRRRARCAVSSGGVQVAV